MTPINRISLGTGVLLRIGDSILLQHNKRYNRFNLISGHYEREVDEFSIKNTIIRETQEELPGLRYLVDFQVRGLHTNRVFWNSNIVREGKEFHTLYIFKFYEGNLLYKTSDFPERLFSSEEEAKEFFQKGDNILISIDDLRQLMTMPESIEMKIEWNGNPYPIGLPVKKVLDVYWNLPTMQKLSLHKEELASRVSPAKDFEFKTKSSDSFRVSALSVLSTKITQYESLEGFIKEVHSQEGLIGLIYEKENPCFKKRLLRNLKELQSLGVDFVVLGEAVDEEVLDIFEELELFWVKM